MQAFTAFVSGLRNRGLAELYNAASAFVRNEHFDPFTGWKLDDAGCVQNRESAYMDIEKYNKHLFDRAAAEFVEQAGQRDLALYKQDVLAQLKADNADIAAIGYDDAARRENLGKLNIYSCLYHGEVQCLTDLYIAAKENGLDTKNVNLMAFHKGSFNMRHTRGITRSGSWIGYLEVPVGWRDGETGAGKIAAGILSPRARLDLVAEIRAKLVTASFGLEQERAFFDEYLHPCIRQSSARDDFLKFLSRLLDLCNRKSLGQTGTRRAGR
jgi:hypothetical protein